MKSLRQAAGIIVEPVEQIEKPKESKFMSFMHNLKTMLADSDDISALSTKRVLSCLAFFCCMIGFFVDLFTNLQVSQEIYSSMMWVAIAGMGFTGFEKFAPKK